MNYETKTHLYYSIIVRDFLVAGGFSGGSVGKNLCASVGDVGSVPELRRFSGTGNGNSLQYSCLGNPINREAWRGTVHVITRESDMTK